MAPIISFFHVLVMTIVSCRIAHFARVLCQLHQKKELVKGVTASNEKALEVHSKSGWWFGSANHLDLDSHFRLPRY